MNKILVENFKKEANSLQIDVLNAQKNNMLTTEGNGFNIAESSSNQENLIEKRISQEFSNENRKILIIINFF